MADKRKYNTRIEAIMAYLRSFLDDKEEPKKTKLKKGEKSLLEQINFGGDYEERSEGGSIENRRILVNVLLKVELSGMMV